MSIEHTARHAADAGYRAVVASDGTSTVDDEWQHAALNYAMQNVAPVATCAEITAALAAELRRRAVGRERDRRPAAARARSPTRARRSPSRIPSTGETIAEVPRMGEAETRRALAAAEEALPGLACGCSRRSAARILRDWADLMMDERRSSSPALLTHRAGQAARRVARRDRLRRVVPRVVRRGGEARLRRHDPDATCTTGASSSPRSRSASPPGITPWNFPAAMVDAQGGARARGRLHDGAEAGRADAALGARGRAARARRPGCRAGVLGIVTGAPRTRR